MIPSVLSVLAVCCFLHLPNVFRLASDQNWLDAFGGVFYLVAATGLYIGLLGRPRLAMQLLIFLIPLVPAACLTWTHFHLTLNASLMSMLYIDLATTIHEFLNPLSLAGLLLGGGLLGYGYMLVCRPVCLRLAGWRRLALVLVCLALLFAAPVLRYRTLKPDRVWFWTQETTKAIFPLALPGEVVAAYTNVQALRQQVPADFPCSVAPGFPDNAVVVVVVGETSRTANWSLFGYRRNTNPRLGSFPGLVPFRDACSASWMTHSSLPRMFTHAIPAGEPSVVNAFNQAGFHSFCLRHPYAAGLLISDRLASEAAQVTQAGPHDTGLLPAFEQALLTSRGRTFVMLQTSGSHWRYDHRYPAEWDYFRPSGREVKVSPLSLDKRDVLVNGYDNSIRYTDEFLSELIEGLQKSKRPAALLYISDHGENLMDDEHSLSLHSVATRHTTSVPLVLWFSENYRKQLPDRYASAQQHSGQPFTAALDTFWTILDLGGIRCEGFDPARSVVSDQFSPSPARPIYTPFGNTTVDYSTLR